METAEHPTTTATSVDPELFLGRFRVEGRLGSGGFGTVFLAQDEQLGREVAIKRIPVPDADAARRAKREGKATAKLSHPAIVALYETLADEGHVYLVSEYVPGATYARLLEIGALSDRDVVEVGVALCDALAHAHKRGIVHRDVKPPNILVPEGGDGPAAKLTDFGVAWVADDDRLTHPGDVVGTLAYMAPEQAEGREVGEEADLYALGLCLYEGLSGVNPVRARGAGATARRVGQRLPPLGRLRRDLPLDLCEAIDATVWPHADERGTVAELRASLCAALDDVGDEPGTIAGGPIEALAPVAPPRRYGLVARAAAAGGAAALAGAALRWGVDGVVAPVAPLTGALAVALAALLLPRLAWMAACAALVGWLASEGGVGGGGGDRAWLLAAAALPIPVLLQRATPVTWSLPALAPVMGLIAVAGAFPALAARAGRVEHRAFAGALGAWWLLLGEAAFGEKLVLGPPHQNGFDALGAVITSPAIVLVGVWAAAAAVLPFLVRGRLVVLDAIAAAAWATALAFGTQAALGATPRGLVEGALLAGALALAPLARHLRSAERVDLP